ncbi:uncharacterized protein LOC103132292 isoform X1 [Poecilia formosa]|uniref:uncharacterized protein LOC103132292 isoform X1 n=1 Tax=Poecilia formosa TaxID=48698 RepID=UPI0007BA5910|nr:PREDICTED: uncharacterized protein LOC103132292 isoform X1 [Poecilia formosa]
MNFVFTLVCFFFTALQDGETMRSFTGKEGGSITVPCEFGLSGNKKFLCKEVCEGGNILIETTQSRDRRGRYWIQYEKRGVLSSEQVYVGINELKPSDSGRYLCRSGQRILSQSDDFHLVVTEGPKTTSSSLSPSVTRKLSEESAAASGLQLYVILSLIAKIILLSTPLVIFCWKRRAMKSKGLQLYVILSLVAKIILLSTPLVIFCWKRRAMKRNDSAGETENADVSQINPEREEIPEGRQNNSSADEIISVYS